ncbi:MAG: hypothetical protein AAGA68_24955 [Pseudomonadota bacterium]
MELGRLIDFFENRLNVKEFRLLLQQEARDHYRKLGKTGVSAPIYLIGDKAYKISAANLDRIIGCYISDDLPIECVRYLFEVMQMYDGFSFSSSELEDVLHAAFDECELTPPSPSDVQEIKERIAELMAGEQPHGG